MSETIGFHLPTEPYGCFSNWYPAKFTYAGVDYNCAEQYMMAQKVALGRRQDLVQKIMESADPAEIKAFGGKDSFPEFMEIKPIWDKYCRHIVKRGVRAKFRQNPDMLRELLDTGDALLCECAGQDRIWGVGINLRNPAWHDVSNWNGSNYLGVILMEVREDLRREITQSGSAQYIDYKHAAAIPEWKTTPFRLKRYPQYYAAVHAYADQLPIGHARDAFYNCTFETLENQMRVNMGCNLPVAGFYEMKQDIFETARRLHGAPGKTGRLSGMTENEFRICYSQLIEYYQYIEMRLRMLCAEFLADEEKDWFAHLSDYDTDPLGKLISKTQELQSRKREEWLSCEDFQELETLRQTRNVWTHKCFGGYNHVCFSGEHVRNPAYAKKLAADLQTVMDWNEKLTEIMRRMKQANA